MRTMGNPGGPASSDVVDENAPQIRLNEKGEFIIDETSLMEMGAVAGNDGNTDLTMFTGADTVAKTDKNRRKAKVTL